MSPFLSFIFGGLKQRLGSVTIGALIAALSCICILSMEKLSKDIPQYARSKIGTLDIVIGPKAANQDLVLCCAIHEKEALGLVDYDDLKAELAANNTANMIKAMAPLALGDSYQGNRILWTDKQIGKIYDLEIAKGRMFDKPMEIVLGAHIAKKLNLGIGAQIRTSHGFSIPSNSTQNHSHEELYEIVGILNQNNSIIDDLLMADISSIEIVHHDVHNENEANNAHNHESANQMVNAALLRLKSPIYQAGFSQIMIKNEKYSAVSPLLETARTMNLIRPIIDIIMGFGVALAMLALLNSSFSFAQSLSKRQRDFFLLRTMGASDFSIFKILFLEVSIIGNFIFLLSAGGFILLANLIEIKTAYKIAFDYALAFKLYAISIFIPIFGALMPYLVFLMKSKEDQLRL